MNFNVGDRVELTSTDFSPISAQIGDLGTVISIDGMGVGVDFDRDVGGHDFFELKLCNPGHGWLVNCRDVKKIDEASTVSVDVTGYL